MKQPLEDIVADIICETLAVKKSKVLPECDLVTDLGADPLDAVEILMFIEERFNLHIPEEDSERLHTVGDIIEYLKSRCA